MGALYFFNAHFLSNAHPCQIDCTDLQGNETVTLLSVDAAFNYMKAQLFGDSASATRICASGSPEEARSIGAKVNGDFQMQDSWDRGVAKQTMLEALKKKFPPGGDLARELADTGKSRLALASQRDLTWGIGCSVVEGQLGMVWVGENLLGELLETVRGGLGGRRNQKRKEKRPMCKRKETGPICACSPLCPIEERPKEGVECEGCEMEFGCFKVAVAHEKGCPEYAQFLALEAQRVDAAVVAVGGAATVGAAAEEGQWSHMVKPSGKKPTIPDGGGSHGVREPRISTKGGTDIGQKRGATLATMSTGKKAKRTLATISTGDKPKSTALGVIPKEGIPKKVTLLHSKIDFKEGDSVRVPWGKKGKKRVNATVVKIDWDKGTKPVQVEFGSRETAWVTASCVEESTKPNQEELAAKAVQNYENSQHNKTNQAAIRPDKVSDMNCLSLALCSHSMVPGEVPNDPGSSCLLDVLLQQSCSVEQLPLHEQRVHLKDDSQTVNIASDNPVLGG